MFNSLLSDLDAEGRSARDIRRSGQQLLPRGFWTRPEGGDPTSRRAQQSQRPVQRAGQALFNRAHLERREIKGMRQRAGFQLAVGVGLPAQLDGDGPTLPALAPRTGSRGQSP